MNLLVDGLVVADLVRGRAPTMAAATTKVFYSVTYAEYVFLQEIATRAAERNTTPAVVEAINVASGYLLDTGSWVASLLDLDNAAEYGHPIELLNPPRAAAKHSWAVQNAFGLSDRETTNLLTADAHNMTYCASPGLLSDAMRRALSARNIDLAVAE
jgi:hypothetical protein